MPSGPRPVNGLSAPAVPAGQTTVTVGYRVVTTDPTAVLEAAKTSADISH